MAVTEAVETELIPVLDLQPLLDGDAEGTRELGRQLRPALREIGFFFIVNHGIPWDEVEAVYAAAAELHALPQEEKDAMPLSRLIGGYLGMGGGTSFASDIAGEVRKPNQNEAYFVHEGGYREANQYPDLDGFRELTAHYMEIMSNLGHSLLPVLAASLDLPADWFEPHFDVPSVTLRMSHYPVMEYEDDEWGVAPHTDGSMLTFLPTNDTPGLEIRPAGRGWITPPVLAEAFLVNSGDILKRWTNDHFLSTAHRVRNASEIDRYAIPFFYGARDDAVLEAAPTTVSDDNPAVYDPITYGDYQRWFLNRNYAAVTGQTATAEAP
ncbi:MAG: 2-oxoglutarate and iron-dependent oxygenase domain-containing protein [Actinomycetota bacterium]|jgi:isopenicillin N synthase-like dioxygenase|nr:2-oxoglutarate and iron-dependent oxygenase domain-containing protein [Actinomycetota bacterium]